MGWSSFKYRTYKPEKKNHIVKPYKPRQSPTKKGI